MPWQRARRPGPVREWLRADGVVVAGAAALGALVFWLMHRALVDDAYITLVYARNLVETGQWGLLPGHVSNTATSPLNVLVLALLTAVTGGAVKGLGLFTVINAAALAVGLLGLGRQTGLGRRFAVVAAVLLLANPLLASTAGLETMLAVTCVVLLIWLSGERRAWPVGVVAGLTVLVRLDLAVVVAVVLLLRRRQWRRLHWVALWAVVAAAPWFVWSWYHLGSAIPDTFLMKADKSPGKYPLGLLRHYGPAYPLGVAGTLAPVAVGVLTVLAWPVWRRLRPCVDCLAVPVAAVAGAAYFLTFTALQVWPFFWYYGVPVAMLTLCAAAGVAVLSYQGPALVRLTAAGLALAVSVVPAGIAWADGMAAGTPLRIALVKGNWAEPWQYARIGRDLHRMFGDRVAIKSPGEIGTLLFFCRCTLVDSFSDRARLVPRIEEARSQSELMRLNYRWLDTSSLEMIAPTYALHWEPGPDPFQGRWTVTSPTGHRQHVGHLELLKRRELHRLKGRG